MNATPNHAPPRTGDEPSSTVAERGVLTRFYTRSVKQIFLILVLSALTFSCASARDTDEFALSCSRVLRALRNADWTAFRAESADEIVFERLERIYLQQLPPATAKALVGPPGWISNNYLDDGGTEPTASNDQNVLISHRVAMIAQPTQDERRAFTTFCDFVRETYGWHNPPVRQARNLHGEEVKSLFGPAIEGKVASNFKWRVQLELISGHWRVRKLISTSH